MTSSHIKVGVMGELATRKFLESKGLQFLEANYRAKTGEIDLILKSKDRIHFIEVKTVTRGTWKDRASDLLSSDATSVPHETGGWFSTLFAHLVPKSAHKDILSGWEIVPHETFYTSQKRVSHETWRPEENVHPEKLRKIGNTLEVWIHKHRYKGNWQIDVSAVELYPDAQKAVIKMIDNVILG